jgi:uncharacterized protein YneF (UPF0154 family)
MGINAGIALGVTLIASIVFAAVWLSTFGILFLRPDRTAASNAVSIASLIAGAFLGVWLLSRPIHAAERSRAAIVLGYLTGMFIAIHVVKDIIAKHPTLHSHDQLKFRAYLIIPFLGALAGTLIRKRPAATSYKQ